MSEITRPEGTEQSTHGDQKEEQRTGEESPQDGEDSEKPKVARKGTMAVTMEVCCVFVLCVCMWGRMEEPALSMWSCKATLYP